VRWIRGQCDAAGIAGGRVVATIFAPAPARPPIPPIGLAAQVHCPFLFDTDKYISGEDEAQSIELAIGFVCTLFVHHGVRDIVVSLTPPGRDETC
jgi:hypothetical protein